MTDITLNPPTVSLIQTLSTPAVQGGLRLVEGQLIRATVQKASESALTLNVNGRTLVAHSELPLRAGQQISLTVASVDTSRIILRMLPPTPSPSQAGATTESLAPLLQEWGLEANELNLTIARSLLARTLTVDPEAVRFIHRQLQLFSPDVHTTSATQSLSAAQRADVEALVHLFANELPISQESLELVRHQQQQPQSPASQISQLRSAMEAVMSQLGSAEHDTPQLSGLRSALQAATTQISEWASPINLPPEQVANGLQTLIPRLATPTEAVLVSLLLAADSGEAAHPMASDLDPSQSTGLKAAVGGKDIDLSALRNQPQKVLYDLLRAVDEVLHNKETLSKPFGQAVRHLGEQLQSVTQDLTAAHLSNIGANSSALAEPCYLFPIPVATPSGLQTVFLKVFRQPEQHAIDPENMRIALLFDLPDLGEIAVNLTISARSVSGQVLSGRQDTHRLVTDRLGDLHQRIMNLGYSVGTLFCDMLATAGGQHVTHADDSLQTILTTTTIDLTV